jgi:flagellar M-ring protein FliF
MKFDPGAIFAQFVAGFMRLPLAQKIALPLFIAASMGTLIFVSNWANRPDYQTLYTNLDEADAGAVVEKLKDLKIGYRIGDDGKRIDITPPSMVHEIRLDLASSGLPKGNSVGYEIFDQVRLGDTALSEFVRGLRAKQGELERTIQSIEAVRAVRVHINAPEKSSFVKKDILPTASVLLKLKAGQELSPAQIKGIAHLVAHSIERLTADNVTIIDSKGNPLNEKHDENDVSAVESTRLDYQRKIEKDYGRQIETMLAGVLGPNRAIARVTADLDFSTFAKEEEIYDPGSRVARSERSVEEGLGQSAEGGIPGVISNLTNSPGVLTPPDGTKGANRRSETVRNYEVSRAVSKTNSATGKLQRLSVAVLVDGQYVNGEVPKGATPTVDAVASKVYKPLPSEMLRKIENLVKQSVGFDASRGDIVTVENMKFFEADDSLDKVLEKQASTDFIATIVGYAAPIIGVLLFFFVLVRPMIKFLLSPTDAEVDLSRLLPAGIEELEAELEAERSKVSSMPELTSPVVNMEELEQLLGENSRLVKESPQQAALLIRYWLNDGRI